MYGAPTTHALLLLALDVPLELGTAVLADDLTSRRHRGVDQRDLLFKNGLVVDGSGSPPFEGDVAVAGGRVRQVGRLKPRPGVRTIDIRDHIIAPGFVDMHAHSDLALLTHPMAEAKLMQGVTTEVIGQDGLSFAPASPAATDVVRSQTASWNGEPEAVTWRSLSVRDYLGLLDQRTSVNVAYLLPHGTIRLSVMGPGDREPTHNEILEMQHLVRQGISEGAVGLSTGLSYPPAMFASAAELTALCQEAATMGGFFSPHHRSYGRGALEAYTEMIGVCREARCPLHLTHCLMNFPENAGRVADLIQLLNAAAVTGIDLTIDTYPYLPGSTYLASFLPNWVSTDGQDGILAHLSDLSTCRRIKHEMEVVGVAGYHFVPMDWNSLEVSSVMTARNERWIGKRLGQIAQEMNVDPFEVARTMLLQERLNVGVLVHVGHEENMRALMVLPYHTAGSDGILVGQKPHPRAWGTFARFLAHYARDEHLFSWQEIVRHMSTLPYRRLAQWDRGLIRPGMMADLVVFHPQLTRDTATFETPRQYPLGIPYVAVNGVLVKDEGAHTGALPGRALTIPRPIHRSPRPPTSGPHPH